MIPEISIIVPMFNAASYIERCITSVLEQEYRNWELIVSDDGSADESLQKALALRVGNENQIIVLENAHSGVVKTRNVAVRLARGRYLMFLDADDYLPAGALQKMINSMNEKNADILVGGYTLVWALDGGLERSVNHKKTVFGGVLEYCILHGESFLWGKLYRRSLFLESVRIPEEICFQEDFVAQLQYSRHVHKCAILNESIYYYVQHDSNATRTTTEKTIFSCLKINEIIETFLLDPSTTDRVKRALCSAWISNLYSCYHDGWEKRMTHKLSSKNNSWRRVLSMPCLRKFLYKKYVLSLYALMPNMARVLDIGWTYLICHLKAIIRFLKKQGTP